MNSSHLSNLQESTLQTPKKSLPQKIQATLVYSQRNKRNTEFAPFEKKKLVKVKNSFGIVLKNSYDQYNRRIITIAWWKNNSTEIERKFSYPYEDLKPLSITPLDQLIPQRTIVLIPKGTTILINNDITILQETLFFLKEIDSQGNYHLINSESSYIFPYSNFPGVPFACLVEFPTLKELRAAENHLDKLQLRILAGAWLINNQPSNLADYLKENTDAFLKSEFAKSISLIEKTWLDKDFNSAWNQAISNYLTLSLKTEGLQGYKVHERLVHRFNRPSEFATLINIDLTLDKPYQLSNNYFLNKSEILEWSQIKRIYLSNEVCYDLDEYQTYFQAYFGFNSQKCGKSWLKEIKKQIGSLSHLKSIDNAPTSHKYHYHVINFKQKTIKCRIKHLQIIASWNLNKNKLN